MGSLPGPTSKLLLLLLPVGSSCCGFLGADRLGSLPKNLVHVALVFFILPFAFHAWLYRVLWHSTTPPTDFGSTAVVVAVQNVGRFIYFPLSLRSELLAKQKGNRANGLLLLLVDTWPALRKRSKPITGCFSLRVCQLCSMEEEYLFPFFFPWKSCWGARGFLCWRN